MHQAYRHNHRNHYVVEEVPNTDDNTESKSGPTMLCLSCKEEYSSPDAGTCQECYDEASETEEELRRVITDLKSRIAFLSFLDHDRPLDPPSFRSGCCGNHGTGKGYRVPAFADVVLVGSEDDGDSVPVPAHRAVLAVVKSMDRLLNLCLHQPHHDLRLQPNLFHPSKWKTTRTLHPLPPLEAYAKETPYQPSFLSSALKS